MRLLTLLFVGLTAFPLVACGPSDDGTYQGYAEGEYVRVAPLTGGIIDAIPVQRGDKVEDGALLFQLDQTAEIAAHDQAVAQVAEARATLNDLTKGLRKSELDQIKAARASARANAEKADADFARSKVLYADGHISKSAYDSAKTSRDAANATLRETEARLATGKLSARIDQIASAEAGVKAAEAALDKANWQLAQRDGHAPQGGFVEDVYFRVGEMAGPGQPIVSILPPANIKLRFFIPEPQLGAVHTGDKVELACDACAKNLTGTVRYISSEAEFTPPVIYSENLKAKLVYMAEATPDSAPESLHPGQPVRVTLLRKEQ